MGAATKTTFFRQIFSMRGQLNIFGNCFSYVSI